jgi:hypothetical protein
MHRWPQSAWSLDLEERNFGDLLLLESAKQLFSYEKLTSKGFACGLFGGSALDEYWFNYFLEKYPESKVLFWGCGVREDLELNHPAGQIKILGVRGPISKKNIKRASIIGDPGLISPILLNVSPKHESGKIYFVPHYSDPQKFIADAIFLDVRLTSYESSRDILEKLASARFVLTGSLHVGIACFALGTPFAFFKDEFLDNEVKYWDFLLNYDIELFYAKNVNEGVDFYFRNFNGFKGIKVQHLIKIIRSAKKFSKKENVPSFFDLYRYLKLRKTVLEFKTHRLGDQFR